MKIKMITQDVCPQCNVMDIILQSDPEVNALVERVNIDREENKHVPEKYGLMGTPVLLIFDEDGNEIDRVVGVRGLNVGQIKEKLK